MAAAPRRSSARLTRSGRCPFTAPANAHLIEFADHEALMERAFLVVGHGGHGTTMRALRHGLPMVGILRAAAEGVLADPRYREEAIIRSHAFDDLDGAQLAGASVESLLSKTPHRTVATTAS